MVALLAVLCVYGSPVGVVGEMEGNTATARKELKREEMDGRVEAVKGVLGRDVMRKGVWEEEEVKEVVASFITSLFFSGPLNPCLPVLLTAETSHGMLEAVSEGEYELLHSWDIKSVFFFLVFLRPYISHSLPCLLVSFRIFLFTPTLFPPICFSSLSVRCC